MKILGYKYGFLIGNEIKCYYDDGKDFIEMATIQKKKL
jgi:hypothetical protein